MASGAKTQKRTATNRSKQTQRSGLPLVIARVPLRLIRWLAHLDLPERLKREVAGLILLTLAALLLLPIFGLGDRMALAGLAGDSLRSLLGRGAALAPLGLLWLSAEMLFSNDVGSRRRRTVGYGLFTIAIVTFLHLIGGETVQQAGGYIGAGFGELLGLIVGEVGAGIVIFSVGLVGIYFLTGADALSVIQTWKAARGKRQAARALQRAKDVTTRPTPAAEPLRKVAEPVAEPLVRESRPVINVPKRPRSTPAKENEKTTATSVTETTDAIPLPLPDIKKLALYEGGVPDDNELEEKANLIQQTLGNFKVDVFVREIFPGPAVTLFALEPGPGVKVRRITELQNDLALALAAKSLRIEAPVPGMARVGIEIPNSSIHTVGLRETIESAEFQSSKAKLPIGLGRDVNGSYVVTDLARMPHLLIAGSTGSGKSVSINGIIATFLLTRRPEELQMVLIDPKMVELVGFNGVPHLRCPVVTDMDKVVGTLRLVLKEMEDRYQRFSSLGVRNIDGYNLRREDDPSLETLPYLVVIIDELADLMMTTPDEVETILVRLTQMARATGIHLLIATQRPSVDVLTGLIKANVPARIAFAVTSQTDSRVIMDMPGAERLLGKGDMLYMPPDAAKPHRVQGSFIEDRDLQFVVRHWRKVAPDFSYEESWLDVPSAGADGDEGEEDPLLEQAMKIVTQQGSASASMLQRRLRIGYNRASRLIEQLEDEGIVGPADGSRSRPVYVSDDVD